MFDLIRRCKTIKYFVRMLFHACYAKLALAWWSYKKRVLHARKKIRVCAKKPTFVQQL